MLIAEGFASLDDIAYVPIEELKAIEGFDETIAEELQRRASDVLLTQELLGDDIAEPAKDLLEVEGMTQQLADQLASHGIATREDLADQSVDELQELLDMDEALAGKLIMSARSHWFENE